jgi:ABC-type Fe3+ transport system permease subunit
VTTTTGARNFDSKRLVAGLTVGVPLIFMVLVFVYPLVNILVTGLSDEGGALAAFGDVLSKPSLRGVAWFTVWPYSPGTTSLDERCCVPPSPFRS